MNSTIIRGTLKAGFGTAYKKWGSLTGNKKIYAEGLAVELMGKTQRGYGKLIDSRDRVTQIVVKKEKNTNKAVMKKVRKLHINDRLKQAVNDLRLSIPALVVTVAIWALTK
jgi:uncharacterized protein YjbJ (UPF0337 family)